MGCRSPKLFDVFKGRSKPASSKASGISKNSCFGKQGGFAKLQLFTEELHMNNRIASKQLEVTEEF